MATSTSTLLEVANRVLLNANERTLTALTPLLGQQVKECIRAAYFRMVRDGEWLWNESKVNASSWSSEVATLPANVLKVKMVVWDNGDDVFLPLKHLPRYVFDQYPTDNYNSTTQQGRALFWTQADHNSIYVHPYPNDATERAKIWFHVQTVPTFPATDATVFPVPEDFIPVLVLSATAMFLKRHAGDIQLSQSFEQEYLADLVQLRTKQNRIPNNSWNLYRGRKVSTYDVW